MALCPVKEFIDPQARRGTKGLLGKSRELPHPLSTLLPRLPHCCLSKPFQNEEKRAY
jgi:hypothetical protein